jgi:hypothetical protein
MQNGYKANKFQMKIFSFKVFIRLKKLYQVECAYWFSLVNQNSCNVWTKLISVENAESVAASSVVVGHDLAY